VGTKDIREVCVIDGRTRKALRINDSVVLEFSNEIEFEMVRKIIDEIYEMIALDLLFQVQYEIVKIDLTLVKAG